jgi:hypothetical protein
MSLIHSCFGGEGEKESERRTHFFVEEVLEEEEEEFFSIACAI